MKKLLILSGPDGSIEDNRLAALAMLLGISTEIQLFDRNTGPALDLLSQVPSGACALAMHVATLRQLFESNPRTELLDELGRSVQVIFIYGASTSCEVHEALAVLTGGAIRGIRSQPAAIVRYCLSKDRQDVSAQLAGHHLLTSREHSLPVLEIGPECRTVETIIAANEHPVFVRFRAAARNVFVFAGHMPDSNEPLSRGMGLGDESVHLLPPLVFLRHCFGERCWHPSEATARLIIDDPILRRVYGALDFEILKASMRRLRYGTSVAFIPWNHWRSLRRSAARLLSAESNLSICIHGCDHTTHEFQFGSASTLTHKAALGIQRMERHRKRVGVTFEDVMVFPYEQFSRAAIPALRSTNYLAAVNSTWFPTDYAPHDIKVADFLWPALTCFDGFPIFQRRCPGRMFDCALDLFLGKPVLLFEHHDYFRENCKAIEQVVCALQHIEPRLSWPSLTTQLMRSNLRRCSNDGHTEVRFFTRRFQFVAKQGEVCRYLLTKAEPDPGAVSKVLVDGKSASFGFENGFLKIEIDAVPRQAKSIEIIDQGIPRRAVRSFGIAHNTRVFARRALSEFRDNNLSRHNGALRIAKKIARVLKTTGDS